MKGPYFFAMESESIYILFTWVEQYSQQLWRGQNKRNRPFFFVGLFESLPPSPRHEFLPKHRINSNALNVNLRLNILETMELLTDGDGELACW
jgi:hypothetical protein